MGKCKVVDGTKSQFPHPIKIGKLTIERMSCFLAPNIFFQEVPYILQNHPKRYGIGQQTRPPPPPPPPDNVSSSRPFLLPEEVSRTQIFVPGQRTSHQDIPRYLLISHGIPGDYRFQTPCSCPITNEASNV